MLSISGNIFLIVCTVKTEYNLASRRNSRQAGLHIVYINNIAIFVQDFKSSTIGKQCLKWEDIY